LIENLSKIVADTSIIINGQLVAQIELGNIKNSEIIIPQAVLDELQSQASQKKDQGFIGLETIKKLKDLSSIFGFTILITGSHLTSEDIQMAGTGRIDAIIKDVAKQNRAILYTSDNVQHLVAQAEGLESVFVKPISKILVLEFLKFFDSETMSIHLKENMSPMAKKGKPGSFVLTKLSDEILTKEYLQLISSQIFETTRFSDSSTIEISKNGASVIQYND